MDKKRYITRKCIVCLEPATNGTGHLLKGNTIVTAGFCGTHIFLGGHIKPDYLLNREGCFGYWGRRYGIMVEKD